MKNLIIITLSLFLFCSCKKGNSPAGSISVTSLNSTENQLLGTWFQYKARVYNTISDTSYTGYDNSYYVQFKGDQFQNQSGNANWKQVVTAFLGYAPIGQSTAFPIYWYYDATISKLVIGTTQYTIEELSGSNLTIKNVGAATAVIYFHR